MTRNPSLILVFSVAMLPFIGAIGFSQEFDHTSLSCAKPYYGSPPYNYDVSEFYFITIKTSPEVVRKLVPEPLNPVSDGVITFVFSKLHLLNPSKLDYLEALITIPVSHDNIVGDYIPVLYLSEFAGISPGREIFGYNKHMAHIEFEENDNIVSVTVSRLDTIIIKASFTLGEPVPPPEKDRSPYTFLHKFIPSIEKDAEPDVNQITLMESRSAKPEMFRPAKASLSLSATPFDPLDQLPVLGVLGAGYMRRSMVLDYGKVAHDFLAE